jgi:hypothetical protein
MPRCLDNAQRYGDLGNRSRVTTPMHVDGDAWLAMRALAWALMNKAAAMFGGSQQRCTQRKTQSCRAEAC